MKKTLIDKINNLFEIEYLDSMADVQGDVKLIINKFVKQLKEEFRKDVIIDNFMVNIKEIDETIDNLTGIKPSPSSDSKKEEKQ